MNLSYFVIKKTLENGPRYLIVQGVGGRDLIRLVSISRNVGRSIVTSDKWEVGLGKRQRETLAPVWS